MTESLSANLLLEVSKSAQEFNRWSDHQIDNIESKDAAFTQSIEECECTIAALKENERNLEHLRSQELQKKDAQKSEILRFEEEIAACQQKISSHEIRLSKLEQEKINIVARLQELETEEKEAQRLRQKSMNDLTRGFRLYRFLGLEFEKAENDCMKFSFTQIDRADPSRMFYFLLLVDSNDEYRLVDSNPRLDSVMCDSYVKKLNSDNNISQFVVSMRKAFKRIVEEDTDPYV
mmetsp:Transcript_10077/g.15269  ORF Transcript_10077/g.15269 Transcript_10077/m.15269 type:complete len:234 (-) Transcript_10077:179-880(-)